MVGHVFLYNAGIQQLKTQLNSQTNGYRKAYYRYATCTNLGPIRKDVDMVWDLCPPGCLYPLPWIYSDSRPTRDSAEFLLTW